MKEGVPNPATLKPQKALNRQRALAGFDDHHNALPPLETPERLKGLSPEELIEVEKH